MKWTLIHTFFRSLTLDHLERSLYSLSRQTIKPDEYLFFDNNTDFSPEQIKAVVGKHFNPDPWTYHFEKHGDPQKTTASWCQNQAILRAANEVFVLTKSDCIYDFKYCEAVIGTFAYISQYGQNPFVFVATWLFQMGYWSQASHEAVDHAADLEPLNWRECPQNLLRNTKTGSQEHKRAEEDAASFCTTRSAVAQAGWYDEHLFGWGYWQIDLQGQMRARGHQFVIVPHFLYFHTNHQIEGPERSQQRGYAEWAASPRRAR